MALLARAWNNFVGVELFIQSLFTILIAIIVNEIDYSIIPKWIFFTSISGIGFFFFYQWYVWDMETYVCRSPVCEPKEKVICKTSIKNDENGYALQDTKKICLTEKTKKLWSFEHQTHARPGSTPGFREGYEYFTPRCYDPVGEYVDCETKFGLSQYADRN
ncbi:hypothetical protein [Acinetobacter sp. WCHAc010052]|uniref:hypothetical protein n=1 Tax=Acinetobacter sp. WCHAc010052 TaxID=2004647 RepID=UPI000B3C3D22|nr:hypothetical protein [Acinetobacter sp. WCHAc010052]AXY59532.1 hypothetical protein CDG61_05510 [Acinetobacter sp. WCHAc010052]